MVIPSPTLAGAVHATLAMFCIIVGLIQLLRRKGRATHTAVVTAVGYVLINRYRPAGNSPRATDETMQHHGASS